MKAKSMIMAVALGWATMNVGTASAVENTRMENPTEMTGAVSAQEENLLVNIEHYDRVLSHDTDSYRQVFYAHETVYIYVSGDGDTDLDLYVYDENGNLIDSDTDNDDKCLCIFTPRWKGTFTIRIKNHGSLYNNYRLRMLQ